MKCYDCPRNCGIDRAQTLGFCLENEKIRVSTVIENFMWEEPCITGDKGALAIFFSGCNLRCKFCQNYEISHIGKGDRFTPKQFADFLSKFDYSKFSCVDLITPTHFSSALCEAFSYFKPPIPIVWNSSGYEKPEIIEKVSKFVDVFLVDFKYFDNKVAQDLSCSDNYFDYASKAILKMCNLKPEVMQNGFMSQGVIIRHLILPGHTRDSLKVLDYIKKHFKNAQVSIMSQFTPIKQSPIQRKLMPLEVKIVLSHAQKLNLHGYFQDLDSASDKFIPNF